MSENKRIHPVWLALGAGALILALAAGSTLWQMWRMAPGATVADGAAVTPGTPGTRHGPMAAEPGNGAPWQILRDTDGQGGARTRVFGLVPGQDTLDDVVGRFGDTVKLGLMARIDEVGALEALVEPLQAGFVAGKLIVAFDAPEAQRQAWRQRSPDNEVMGAGARRFALSAVDIEAAGTSRIGSLSFIPSLRLSADDVRARFGEPAEARALPDDVQALAYPDRGLLALVRPGSRALLMYAAPGDFDARLRPMLLGEAAPER